MVVLAALAIAAAACGSPETATQDPAGAPAPATAPSADPGRMTGEESSPPTPGSDAPAPELADMPPFERSRVTLVGPEGGAGRDVPVYVADTPAERGRGLMGVEDLPAGAGMLFRFPGDVRAGFYMKNTLIPLSIAFIDADGEVLAVLDMEPCEADPCTVYDPGVTYRTALEVNQGFLDEIGLRPGWRVQEAPGLPPAT